MSQDSSTATRSPITATLAWLRSMGRELWTLRKDPLPSLGGPRLLAWLPHVLVIFVAVLALESNERELSDAYHLGNLGAVIALLQSAGLVLAMFRPIPALWLTTATMVFTAGIAESTANWTASFPWTSFGIVLQAGVLFLLALRLRADAAVLALLVSALAGLACTLALTQPHRLDTGLALAVFTAATVVGAALRVSRVARAQLVEQQVLTAEERTQRTLLQERNRIARELHDVVAHHMSVISIQAQVAPHLVNDPPAELTENLAGIRDNAVEALTELRRVLGVLRADTLTEGAPSSPQPTLDRLGDLIDNVRNAGLSVAVTTTGEPRPLSPGVELSAFRIVQEALSNSIRHAPGAAVHVELGYLPDGVNVRIANTAPDTDDAPPPGGDGHGLLGMRERTAMLGGELTNGPTPDGGYAVTAMLPVKSLPSARPVEDLP